MRAAVLLAAVALAACAHAPAPPATAPMPKPVIKTVVKQVCLPWHEWSADEKTALHDALVPIPDGSAIIKAVREFWRYYTDDKACLDAQK